MRLTIQRLVLHGQSDAEPDICSIRVCPICRTPITDDDLTLLKPQDTQQAVHREHCVLMKVVMQSQKQDSPMDKLYRPSSKMKALLSEVRAMIAEDEDGKMVVFSQWTSMLDLIEVIGFNLADAFSQRCS
jgi:SNF2 family DNA or RNA helicase